MRVSGRPDLRLHGLFFASGALGLVYEVLWMRRFTILFGATAPATAATLCAVFLGFGLGSAVIGSRCAGWARPVRAFGLLEAGVGIGALLSEPVLRVYESLYPSLHASFSGHPSAFIASKGMLAVAAILLPTFFMGGSLPVLGQAVARSHTRLGVDGGGLYAVNTFGAALGALLVPTVLLPCFGLSRSIAMAVAGSVCVACLAGLLDYFGIEATPAEFHQPQRSVQAITSKLPGRVEARDGGEPLLLLLAFASGMLALAAETLWTQMFALVHENSIYSFSLVLAILLVGLASGAAVARTALERGGDARKLLGAAWCAGGILVIISPRLFVTFTGGMDYLAGGGWDRHSAKLGGLAVVIVMPATILIGMVLPLLMELSGFSDKQPGAVLGQLLAANTIGAIVGPLAATFLFQPHLGLWWSIVAAGITMAISGEIVLGGLPRRPASALKRSSAYGLLAVAILLLDPGSLPRVRLEKGEKILALREGAFGTVAVVESDSHRRMKLNNFYVLGGTASTGDERLQAHIPILLHPKPVAVALLGLGTGITAGGALLHPVREIVAIELVPEVVEAARDSFEESNLGFAKDPRVEVVIDDARNYLPASGKTFDVIVGDLFVPWRRGESSLYTQEHFEAVRGALAPGGIFCQWVPLFQLSEEQFRIIVKTFVDVFPSTTLWHGDFRPDEPAVALIGTARGNRLDVEAADRNVRALARRDPSNPYLADPSGLWLYFIGSIDPLDSWLSGARRNRDDRPWIELETPMVHAGILTGRPLTRLLDRFRESPLDGSPLAGLNAEHLRWRETGARLWRASLLSMEGREKEADEEGMSALASLPESIQLAVLGKVICDTDAPTPPVRP